MTCICCTAALTDWTFGGYKTPCRGCEIRAIAQAPKRIREQRYSQVLSKDGEEAMQAYRAEVMAEYRRIGELREKA